MYHKTMDAYAYYFSDKDDNKPVNIPTTTGVKVTDVIKMSQDISGDWLRKEAQKKVVIQEQIQEQKTKSHTPVPVKKDSHKD